MGIAKAREIGGVDGTEVIRTACSLWPVAGNEMRCEDVRALFSAPRYGFTVKVKS